MTSGTLLAYAAGMTRNAIAPLLLLALLAGCAHGQKQPSQYGSTHNHRFQKPPHEAARCFARNAEEHSSALMAQVDASEAGAEAIVRVKNGVTYATASFRRAGTGSTGAVTLMVRASGRNNDLFGNLVEGC